MAAKTERICDFVKLVWRTKSPILDSYLHNKDHRTHLEFNQKWLSYQILVSKTIKNGQIDP